jgi:RNA polymerase sigma-70 factor (ECF subfamily)
MGDMEAMDPLYRRYRGVVSAVIHGQVRGLSPSDSEDLCHEVFITLADIAHRYQPVDTLRGWLCGIALRKARRLREGGWLRRNILARFGAGRSQAPAENPAEHRLDVERILDQLPAQLRDVVVLSLVEQMSPDDIAQSLGIAVVTVRTRLFRARKLVRELTQGDA